MQFKIKIRNASGQSYTNGIVNNNNEIHVSEAVIDDGIALSDLFNKLYNLTMDRGIIYTITECLLDQVSGTSKSCQIQLIHNQKAYCHFHMISFSGI